MNFGRAVYANPLTFIKHAKFMPQFYTYMLICCVAPSRNSYNITYVRANAGDSLINRRTVKTYCLLLRRIKHGSSFKVCQFNLPYLNIETHDTGTNFSYSKFERLEMLANSFM